MKFRALGWLLSSLDWIKMSIKHCRTPSFPVFLCKYEICNSQFYVISTWTTFVFIATSVTCFWSASPHCGRLMFGDWSDLAGNPDSKVHGVNMGPSGADRTQVGPMLAPWTLLSGKLCENIVEKLLKHIGRKVYENAENVLKQGLSWK